LRNLCARRQAIQGLESIIIGATKRCRNKVDQLSSKQEWKLQPGDRVVHGFELFVKEKPHRTIPATAPVSKFVMK
jgi:hypothetical protein